MYLTGAIIAELSKEFVPVVITWQSLASAEKFRAPMFGLQSSSADNGTPSRFSTGEAHTAKRRTLRLENVFK